MEPMSEQAADLPASAANGSDDKAAGESLPPTADLLPPAEHITLSEPEPESAPILPPEATLEPVLDPEEPAAEPNLAPTPEPPALVAPPLAMVVDPLPGPMPVIQLTSEHLVTLSPTAAGSAPVARIVPSSTLLTPDSMLLPLEQRIRRLEAAIVHLQEQQSMETRVTSGRRDRPPTPPAAPSSTPGLLVNVGKRLLGASPEPARPAAPPSEEGAAKRPKSRRSWLVLETIAKARAVLRMYVDPRYRLSWTGRLAPLVLIFAFVTSCYWIPGTSIWIFGTLLNKTIDLALAFVLYKVLGHEARRYRQTAPDLPPTLRL
jgi:hypothetical protein